MPPWTDRREPNTPVLYVRERNDGYAIIAQAGLGLGLGPPHRPLPLVLRAWPLELSSEDQDWSDESRLLVMDISASHKAKQRQDGFPCHPSNDDHLRLDFQGMKGEAILPALGVNRTVGSSGTMGPRRTFRTRPKEHSEVSSLESTERLGLG